MDGSGNVPSLIHRVHKQFTELVREGIAAIPERFQKLMDNVAVVIEEEPTETQLKKMRVPKDRTLFGLYEGIPKTARGAGYTMVLPDKITIFRKPILEVCRSEEEIREEVRKTVWHEIAHHFGLNHERISLRERRRMR
ncbi:metallopeptidase family protein [Candidatus Azambacteria bacterium]|nr:metallopeptidase family protein [Candidatus Azambacteria bacterium]